MNIVCTICSDLVNQAENIYVTKCGHIFHHHCLAQWIERDVLSKYEKQLVSYDSKVKAIREQLTYANIQCNETKALREENTAMKRSMETLTGLQKILNATYDEVEQMLKGYTDLRTIATFATALKRALCESESKKNEWRDKLHHVKQQMALGKKTEIDLQNKVKHLEGELNDRAATIESLKDELNTAAIKKHTRGTPEVDRTPRRKKTRVEIHETPTCPEVDLTSTSDTTTVEVHETPRLNDAILETDSNNTSFNTMVDKIENSDSPYLDLKKGGLLCMTALHRGSKQMADRIACKPAARLYINTIRNATEKRIEPQIATSIFHRKEPMTISSFDANSPIDISYDGMGGHSKPETFPVPKKSPLNSCIPKLSAKHKLKRPNPTSNYDIQTMLKKLRDK